MLLCVCLPILQCGHAFGDVKPRLAASRRKTAGCEPGKLATSAVGRKCQPRPRGGKCPLCLESGLPNSGANSPGSFVIFAAIRRLIPRELETKAWAMVFSGESERETAMRPLPFILGIFAATLCVAQSAAAQNYPWCAYYGPHFGATNCGFSTFQQSWQP